MLHQIKNLGKTVQNEAPQAQKKSQNSFFPIRYFTTFFCNLISLANITCTKMASQLTGPALHSKKQVLLSAFSWYFSLSQIGTSNQYLERSNSTWKDHDRNIWVHFIKKPQLKNDFFPKT